MKYGIVHYGPIAYHHPAVFNPTCEIIAELPHGKTISLWNDSLQKMGIDTATDQPTSKDLFQFVKAEFEKQKNERIDVRFARGYIASLDGTYPIPSDRASRLYSGGNVVYVDELILAALFEYVAAYYLWAREFNDKDVFSSCFRYTAGLLNYACRLGMLTNDEREAQLVQQIIQRYDKVALDLITDLYWSCLAFAFCHELAHIYLRHTDRTDKVDMLWKREYEADAVGYDVYLQIIKRTQENTQEPFAGVFHDYLYTAPMILFQFYEDTYFWSYWLFGERAGNSHPPLRERFDALLRISEQSKYTFDTHEGNILLNNYMDVSKSFRVQLILKLQKGKLHQVIQEGVGIMSQTGYHDAELFQKNMCEALREDAERNGWDSERLIGLWDTAVDIELLDDPRENSFVWSHKGKVYSTKAFNARLSLKKVWISILEFGGSLEFSDNSVKTVFVILLILYKLLDISTVDLSETHATVLIKCHELHADTRPIDEDQLLQLPGVTTSTITELNLLGCIELDDGLVRLKDEIYIH